MLDTHAEADGSTSRPATPTGVDLSQIQARLRLPPAERFRQAVIASRRMIALRRRLRPLGEPTDAELD